MDSRLRGKDNDIFVMYRGWLLKIVTVWYKNSKMIFFEKMLLLDVQANRYRALDRWFYTPQGSRVGQAFATELLAVHDQFQGERLVQLGHCGDNFWLAPLQFRRKWLVHPYALLKKTSLVSSFHALPIDRNSIDCVIAPLTLEAFLRGKSPLDEIDRILKPMGYVVFFGVNPWSLWGGALRMGFVDCFDKESVMLSSSLTLKHALQSRGYKQCALSSFYYIPPVMSPSLIKTLEFFNQMGKMLWPFPAGFYCLIAQKYEPCMPSLEADLLRHELLLEQNASFQTISNTVSK